MENNKIECRAVGYVCGKPNTHDHGPDCTDSCWCRRDPDTGKAKEWLEQNGIK